MQGPFLIAAPCRLLSGSLRNAYTKSCRYWFCNTNEMISCSLSAEPTRKRIILDVSFGYFVQQVFSSPVLAMTVALTLGVIFVNGWTDAPNAIATCVTTRCMRVRPAIIMSAIFNFLGVLIMTHLNASVASTISNMVDFGSDTSTALVALCAALFSIVVYSQALAEKQTEIEEIDRLKASREDFKNEYLKLIQHFMDEAQNSFPPSLMASLPNGSAAAEVAPAAPAPAPEPAAQPVPASQPAVDPFAPQVNFAVDDLD